MSPGWAERRKAIKIPSSAAFLSSLILLPASLSVLGIKNEAV